MRPARFRRFGGARMAAAAALVALAASGRAARAYDPATTHAGLTERAVLASKLHRVLSRRLSRPLGLYEPVSLDLALLPAAEGRALRGRLDALDPSGGYRPTEAGVATALSWIIAGSVLAHVPAERGQHHFLDPSRGVGLDQAGGAFELLHGLRLTLDRQGTVRAVAVGSNFVPAGLASVTWLAAPENDVGLVALLDQLEASVVGDDPAARSTAFARALMAAGGVLSLLEDAGEPAFVRNDFRDAFFTAGSGPFDRGSAYERLVAESYGRAGIPAAGPPVARPTILSYFTASDGQGLADRTQRRFFSDGTIPRDVFIEPDTTVADVLKKATASLPYQMPGVPVLDLGASVHRRYVYAIGDDPGGTPRLSATVPAGARARRVLAYERADGRLQFLLDGAVRGDAARVLLPEIGAYAAGLLDLLFRGEVAFKLDGERLTVEVTGARGQVRNGRLRVFAEDKAGRRREIGAGPAGAGVSVSLPAGTARVAACLRGEDDAGPLVAVGEEEVRR